MNQQQRNERKFKNWTELQDGGRQYWYDILGRQGWKVRHVKVRFYQQIYDQDGQLVEVPRSYRTSARWKGVSSGTHHI